MDKLNSISENISKELKGKELDLPNELNEYLVNLNKAGNEERKKFVLSILDVLQSLEASLKRKERHLHVAVARLMETINFFSDNKLVFYES